jgi:hypothetical protein
MYPLLRSRLVAPVAFSLAIACAFALLLFTIGATPRVTATTAPAVARGSALTVAEADGPQESASSRKGDRLPLPPRSSPPPSSLPAAEPAAPKPAEAFDYAQAEAEQVRGVHAEAPDLCQRHGMHKHYFNVGRRQSWRCER